MGKSEGIMHNVERENLSGEEISGSDERRMVGVRS
jgi:hypothetical protein